MPKEMPDPDIEQQEQLPPILIIYRDNDLFEKYVPEIARILQAKGRRVEIKNFPRGTKKDEIKEWYDENLERLAGTEIISDETANVPYKLYELQEEKGIKDAGSLDGIMGGVTVKAIWGEKTVEFYPSDSRGISKEQLFHQEEQRLNEFYSAIIKYILANPENAPNKIYLFTDHILDHVDIEAYTDINLYTETKLNYDLHEYLTFGKNSDYDKNQEYKEEREKLIKNYTEKIKELLMGGGIDAEKIIIKSGEPTHQELREIDQIGSWIIVDRHSLISRTNDKSIIFAKQLELPEDSFYNSAREAGLIDIPDEEFSQNLEKVIDEKLGS